MIRLVVYVDVLIFLNAVVDYLLLSITAVLTKNKPKFWRKLTAAIVAALFSMYIFLPPFGMGVQLLLRFSSSIAAVMIAFGYGYFRKFLRNTFVFYCVTFIFAGFMTGIYILLEPQSMSINNGIVYFDISPLILITVSFVFYVVMVVFRKIIHRDAESAKRCEVELMLNNKKINKTAMIDTGHTLEDGFGSNTVIIIDKPTAIELLDENNVEKMLNLIPPNPDLGLFFRLIPTKTVSGDSVLPAILLDYINVKIVKNSVIFNKPVAVISKTKLGEDYSVIIPPESTD